MYAIVQLGNHQFKARPGDLITVEKIDGNVGDEVRLNHIVALADGERLKVGKDLQAAVLAEIHAHGKEPKIHVFKKSRRKVYQKKTGHRQLFTTLKIKTIEG